MSSSLRPEDRTAGPRAAGDAEGAQNELPWFVYDRHGTLLQVVGSLEAGEAWAVAHWSVVEIADREEVAPNDLYYLLFAAASAQAGFSARDYQARIMRRDRVEAIGRDTDAPVDLTHTARSGE